MNPLTKDILSFVQALLPGFVAAWVFYGLTPHPKKEPFERVVQALIFTAIVQAVIYIVRWLAGVVATYAFRLGDWTTEVEFVWSIALAMLLGFLFAGLANNDSPHRWIRRRAWHLCSEHETARATLEAPRRHWIWSRRTSFPSEWFSTLNRDRRNIILHFADGRRLLGWPEEFPDQSDSGHFVMFDCEWLLPDGRRAPLYTVDRLIIAVASIVMVEIMKTLDEITADATAIREAEVLLIRVNQGDTDGESSTATPADA